MSETIKTQHIVKIAKSGTGQVLTPEQAAKIMGVDLANEPDFSEEYAQLIEAERERDEWRNRCESLEATWLAAQAECVQLREALEVVDNAYATPQFNGGWIVHLPKDWPRIIASALSSAGRDLLERVRLLETDKETAKELLEYLRDRANAVISNDKTRYDHHEPRPDGKQPREDGGTCWLTPKELAKQMLSAIDAYLKRGGKDA